MNKSINHNTQSYDYNIDRYTGLWYSFLKSKHILYIRLKQPEVMPLIKALSFLKDLSKNNNRDWFNANKQQYLVVKLEFENIIDLLTHEIRKFDSGLGTLQAKDCTFRIYRDVRFSKDKSPYKTQMGAFMVPGGKKSGKAGYYFHLEPGNIFLAGGMYLPPPDILKHVRENIFNNIDEFKSIIQGENFLVQFGAISGEKLKMAPKGFSKEFPDMELLKFKSYTIVKIIDHTAINNKNMIETLARNFKSMKAFNHFLNTSLPD